MKYSLYAGVLVFLFLLPTAGHAQEYYECAVSFDASVGEACEAYRGRVHMCQLYNWTFTPGIPSHCSGFCLNRSGIPAECATVVVRQSNFPEKHEGKSQVEEQIGIDLEALSGIEGAVRDRLSGIENEINTEDGVDQEEVQYVVGRVVGVIQDILGEKISGFFGGIKEKVTGTDEVQSDTEKEDASDQVEDVDEEDPFAETGLDAVKPGEYDFEKWPDEDGTKIAKIIDAYGVERYTSDGKHFYDTPYSAAHSGEGVRGAWNGVKDTFASIGDWFSKAEEKDPDQQLRLDIAREVLADSKSQREKDVEKAYQKLSAKIDTPTFGDVPAKAVVAVAKELPAKDFASAASVYIAEREKGNSQATIRENNSEILSGGYGTFGNQGEVSLSTTNKYAEAVLYARYEEAYQRYKIAKEFGRTD